MNLKKTNERLESNKVFSMFLIALTVYLIISQINYFIIKSPFGLEILNEIKTILIEFNQTNPANQMLTELSQLSPVFSIDFEILFEFFFEIINGNEYQYYSFEFLFGNNYLHGIINSINEMYLAIASFVLIAIRINDLMTEEYNFKNTKKYIWNKKHIFIALIVCTLSYSNINDNFINKGLEYLGVNTTDMSLSQEYLKKPKEEKEIEVEEKQLLAKKSYVSFSIFYFSSIFLFILALKHSKKEDSEEDFKTFLYLLISLFVVTFVDTMLFTTQIKINYYLDSFSLINDGIIYTGILFSFLLYNIVKESTATKKEIFFIFLSSFVFSETIIKMSDKIVLFFLIVMIFVLKKSFTVNGKRLVKAFLWTFFINLIMSINITHFGVILTVIYGVMYIMENITQDFENENNEEKFFNLENISLVVLSVIMQIMDSKIYTESDFFAIVNIFICIYFYRIIIKEVLKKTYFKEKMKQF